MGEKEQTSEISVEETSTALPLASLASALPLASLASALPLASPSSETLPLEKEKEKEKEEPQNENSSSEFPTLLVKIGCSGRTTTVPLHPDNFSPEEKVPSSPLIPQEDKENKENKETEIPLPLAPEEAGEGVTTSRSLKKQTGKLKKRKESPVNSEVQQEPSIAAS